MVSDACAARTDAEHGAALVSFYVTFGDVMSTDQALTALQAMSPHAQHPELARRLLGDR
jgi:hypothetical protein